MGNAKPLSQCAEHPRASWSLCDVLLVFAWEAYEKGTDAHLQADPTKLELLDREFRKKKDEYKTTVKDSILDRYGGKEHLEAPSKQLLLAQTVGVTVCSAFNIAIGLVI